MLAWLRRAGGGTLRELWSEFEAYSLRLRKVERDLAELQARFNHRESLHGDHLTDLPRAHAANKDRLS
jgi:hypothetical protein